MHNAQSTGKRTNCLPHHLRKAYIRPTVLILYDCIFKLKPGILRSTTMSYALERLFYINHSKANPEKELPGIETARWKFDISICSRNPFSQKCQQDKNEIWLSSKRQSFQQHFFIARLQPLYLYCMYAGEMHTELVNYSRVYSREGDCYIIHWVAIYTQRRRVDFQGQNEDCIHTRNKINQWICYQVDSELFSFGKWCMHVDQIWPSHEKSLYPKPLPLCGSNKVK